MMRTRYSYRGVPGTYERGKAERSKQDFMIGTAGGIMEYMRGVRNERYVVKRIDDAHGNVVSYPQPRDAGGKQITV